MIDAIVRGSLGEFGSAILDFYILNRFWINLILLAYALILGVGKFAYRKLTSAVYSAMKKVFGENLADKNRNFFLKHLERSSLDWGTIMKSTWIPFFSPTKSFWIKLTSKETLQEHFTANRLYEIAQSRE